MIAQMKIGIMASAGLATVVVGQVEKSARVGTTDHPSTPTANTNSTLTGRALWDAPHYDGPLADNDIEAKDGFEVEHLDAVKTAEQVESNNDNHNPSPPDHQRNFKNIFKTISNRLKASKLSDETIELYQSKMNELEKAVTQTKSDSQDKLLLGAFQMVTIVSLLLLIGEGEGMF